MSKSFDNTIKCPVCSLSLDGTFYSSINVSVDPALKKNFFEREINWIKCTQCNTKVFVPIEFVYHDMDKKFMVIFKHPQNIDTSTEDFFSNFVDRMKVGDYLSYPVITTDPTQLLLAVMFCDAWLTPISKDEATKITEESKRAADLLNKNDPMLRSVIE